MNRKFCLRMKIEAKCAPGAYVGTRMVRLVVTTIQLATRKKHGRRRRICVASSVTKMTWLRNHDLGGLTFVSFKSNIKVLSTMFCFEDRTKSRARSPEKVDGNGPMVLKPSAG